MTNRIFWNLSSITCAKIQYDVVGVESGEEALAQVRTTLPDLIVLDLMLPGVDGLEVCRTLKRDTRTAAIPIVMLTARRGGGRHCGWA